MLIVNIISWAIILGFLGWLAWNYFRVRRSAKYIPNAEFESMMRGAQIVDLRSASAFRQKHILGARNIPFEQLSNSLSALRKDKPILLYDNTRGQAVARSVVMLKKAGYKDLYVLKNGLDYWNGKVKERS
ncbi:rhodanese-like domain-containing protein [Streptococcus macacae]|uniref:Rhodanese-like protein n=1 Tax=Streptococcus macacae NCTC 11558 TaxID=764298 RepID=G5JW03_9STRE|nr:rhodanese-like domain-containing protein [Streptococcus macacae]EHJ52893.1 rhodanese-like protein [Streptococcus macacae NCTC 11558]SUN78997.1 rhodanese-like domain-containing protein [Streptococcus macacae NCTC 11558]